MASSSSSSVYLNTVALDLEWECPVCFQPFIPPVYQCNNGHAICQKCLPKCQECPICRKPLPKETVRNLSFEKVLVCIAKAKANESIPCPRRGDGCTVLLKKESVKKHLQDECTFVPRMLCLRMGVPGDCNEQFCTGKTNQLMEHLITKHRLKGLNDERKNVSSSATLEVPGTFGMSSIETDFLVLNFMRFDDHMFIIKKYLNLTEGLVAVVVCTIEDLATTRKYSARVQLVSKGPANVLEFNQNEIVVMSKADEVLDLNPRRKFKYHHIELCKVTFPTFANYDRTLGRGKKLEYRAHVTIFKNMEC